MDEKDFLTYKLADLCHQQWSGWMAYLFSKGTYNEDGTWTMPQWAVERWGGQMVTPFADLSEDERDSDLYEASRFQTLFYEHFKWALNIMGGELGSIAQKATMYRELGLSGVADALMRLIDSLWITLQQMLNEYRHMEPEEGR